MIQARLRAYLLLLSDIVTLSAVWVFLAGMYHLLGGNYEMESYYRCWPILFIYVIIASSFNLYHGNLIHAGIALDPVQELRYTVRTVVITYLFFLAYLTASHRTGEYSRLVCIFSAFFSSLLLIPMRNLTRIIMKMLKIGDIPFVLFGKGASAEHLPILLKNDIHYGLKCVGTFDESTIEQGFTKHANVDLLICCVSEQTLKSNFHALTERFSLIVYLQDGCEFPIFWDETACIGHEMFGFQISNRLLLPIPRFIKTILEYIAALLLTVAVLPLMAVIALAVRMSGKGPVFYHAHRLGQYGKPIHILKFRTMFIDADKNLQEVLDHNPELQREWDENMKLTNDPRVTPLGRFLRKTSLDELPQLFDVLAGRIALIGPRPIVEEEIPRYGEYYRYFTQVKPGITGLWQVSGRSDTGYAQRIVLDMWYISRWSVWLDIYIFFATIGSVIQCKGAK